MSDAFSLPFGDLFTLGNYAEAFEKVDILSAYRNSIIISGAVAVLVILMAGMASFALVRYRFRLNKTLYSLVIAAMMFPVFLPYTGFPDGVWMGAGRIRKCMAFTDFSNSSSDSRKSGICHGGAYRIYERAAY